jgi:hypothetical protein
LPWELLASLVAVGAITAAYWYVARRGVPQPGGWIGHGLGIAGFVLMLGAETLYTLRKRLRRLALGSMQTWLQVHVFMGIVGPYLVLLHSAGRINGIAGVVSLLTVIMVLSGFVGRYIYTAAPRTLDGNEVSAESLQEQLAGAERQLQRLGLDAAADLANSVPRGGWSLVLGRSYLQWRERHRLRRVIHSLNLREEAAKLEPLLMDRYRLRLQIHSLMATRRLLALWHLFHIPLGAVLFTLAFIHIGAALYYATFLK